MFRDAYIKVDIDNYRYNINYLRNIHQKKLIAVIKANAYGLVDDIMAKYLQDEGVYTFAVSSLDEAIHLRKCGIKGDIIILSYVDSSYFKLIKEYNLTIVTVSKNYILEAIKHDISGLHFEIKIDSGMHRIGLFKEEVNEIMDLLLKNQAKIDGIFTHFACSDKDDEFTSKQYQYFKNCLDNIDYNFKRIHTCNTDAAIHFDDEISTHIRCGLGLLGYSSYDSLLKPVVSLFARIINIRHIKANEGISYGQNYKLSKDEYIATLPIGYADGIRRSHNQLPVYLNRSLVDIIGSICMDQMMIKVDQETKVHDLVEFFGEHINIQDVAKIYNTINYEILTGLSDRLYRSYWINGKMVKEICPRYR